MNSKTTTLVMIFATLLPVLGAFAAPSATPSPGVFFVANEGQWEEPFAFKLQVGATTYFVTETGLTIDIREYTPPAPPSELGGSRMYPPQPPR